MKANGFASRVVSALRRDYARPILGPNPVVLEFAVIGAVYEYTPITAAGLRLVLGADVSDTLARLAEDNVLVASDGPSASYRVTTREERDPRA